MVRRSKIQKALMSRKANKMNKQLEQNQKLRARTKQMVERGLRLDGTKPTGNLKQDLSRGSSSDYKNAKKGAPKGRTGKVLSNWMKKQAVIGKLTAKRMKK